MCILNLKLSSCEKLYILYKVSLIKYITQCRIQDKISVHTEYISVPTQIGSHIISVTVNQLYLKHQQEKMS